MATGGCKRYLVITLNSVKFGEIGSVRCDIFSDVGSRRERVDWSLHISIEVGEVGYEAYAGFSSFFGHEEGRANPVADFIQRDWLYDVICNKFVD